MDELGKETGKRADRRFEEASDLLAVQETLRGNRNAFAGIVGLSKAQLRFRVALLCLRFEFIDVVGLRHAADRQ